VKRRSISVAVACAWLPTTSTVQARPPPTLGFLSSRSPEESKDHFAAFRQGLAEQGFADASALGIEERWARGEYDRLPRLAAELVHRRVRALVAVGGLPAARAAKAATGTIPVIFLAGDDPIEAGLVKSMSRPEANVTGFSFQTGQLNGKRLALLCETVPDTAPVAFLLNPTNPSSAAAQVDIDHAAKTLGRQVIVVRNSAGSDLADAFGGLVSGHAQALVVQNDPYFDSQRTRIVALAARHRIPAIYHIREFPLSGGLMSYGASLLDAYRDVGRYAARVLQGAKPSELPVVRPTRFELVINANTAKALGLSLSPKLMVLADEVIQ